MPDKRIAECHKLVFSVEQSVTCDDGK